eukprot:7874470-Lingulodinium_polyedra.AAC.1
MFEYIRKHRPFLAVVSPPCAGLAGWCHVNAVVNAATHQRGRRISLTIGRICALVALEQFRHG